MKSTKSSAIAGIQPNMNDDPKYKNHIFENKFASPHVTQVQNLASIGAATASHVDTAANNVVSN
jgi:hypothetical protein